MKDEYYITSDLGLATTLSLFTKIKGTDKSNPRRVMFSFQNTAEVNKMVKDYWDKKLKVEPLTYYMQMRSIKNMIYEQVRQAE